MELQKAYRTPLSEKQKNIRAFSRLLDMARANSYRGRPLNDQTNEDLARAISYWLQCEGYKSFINGSTITIPFSDGNYEIVVAGTHRNHCDYPQPIQSAEFETTVFNLRGFEVWFDQNLNNQP